MIDINSKIYKLLKDTINFLRFFENYQKQNLTIFFKVLNINSKIYEILKDTITFEKYIVHY